MVEIITFAVLALILIASAVCVVRSQNTFHGALFLALFLFTMAGMFVHLRSELVAVIQVLAYVGGVTTFIVFVIMLTNKVMDTSVPRFNRFRVLSVIVTALVLLSFTVAICFSFFQPLNNPVTDEIFPIEKVGALLLSDYLLSFELISIILTVTMIGAILLVKKEER